MLLSEVIDYTADLFDITALDLTADRRKKHIYRARAALYIGLWIRTELTGRAPSYSMVGRSVGDRDHTTIMHGAGNGERDPLFPVLFERLK